MSDDKNDMRLTTREWFAARIVIIGGFLIAIVVVSYFAWSQHEQAQEAAAAAQAQAQAEAKAAAGPTPEEKARARVRMGLVVCLREVINAQAAGIVPNYAKLASVQPQPTKTQGRYTCSAATGVAKYAVTGDLICSDMQKADCVKLQSVTRDDGTVLYQAKE